MDSEADDLEALRNAALATLSSDSKPKKEEEDLEALRRAALITRKQKQIQVLQHPVRVEEPPPPLLFHRPPSNTPPIANLISLTPEIPVVRPMQFPPMPFPHRMPLLGMRPPPHLALHPPLLPLLMPPPRHRPGPMFRPNHRHPRMHRVPPPRQNLKGRPTPLLTSRKPNVAPKKPTEETEAAETKANDKFSRFDADSSSDDDDEHLSSRKGDAEEESEAESTISDVEESSNQNSKNEKQEINENIVTRPEDSETGKSPNIDPPDTPEIETPEPPITPKIFDDEVDVLTIMDEDDILLAIDDFLEDKPVVIEPKKEVKTPKIVESKPKIKPIIEKITAPTKNRTLNPKTQDSYISSSKPVTVVAAATSSTTTKLSASKSTKNDYSKSVKNDAGAQTNRNHLNESQNDIKNTKFVPQRTNRIMQDPFISPLPRQRRDSDLYSVGSSELSFLSSDSETEDNKHTSDAESKEKTVNKRQEDFVEKPAKTLQELHPKRTKNLDLRKKLESKGLTKKNLKGKPSESERSSSKTRNESPKPDFQSKKQKITTKDSKKAVLNIQNTKSYVVEKEKTKKLVGATKLISKRKITAEIEKSEPKNDTVKTQNPSKTRSRNLISFDIKNNSGTRPQVKRSQSPPTRNEKTTTQNKVAVKDRLGRKKRPGSKRDADFDQPTKKSPRVSEEVKPVKRDTTIKRIVLTQSCQDYEEGEIIETKVPKLSSNVRTTPRFNFKNQTEDYLSEDSLSDEDDVSSSRIKISINDPGPGLDSHSEDEKEISRRDFTGIKRRIVINKSPPSPNDVPVNKKKNVKDRLGRISKHTKTEHDNLELKRETNDDEKRPRSAVKKLSRKPTVSIKKVPKTEVRLEEKIRKIKAQNGRILLRQWEIEQEKEKFG